MKNTYFSFLFLLLFTVPSHAQLRYGLEGGVNMSYMSINATQGSAPTTSMLIAYRAGALLDIGINERLSVQTGLYYTVLGYKYNLSQTYAAITFGYNTTVQENFLRLPINIVFKRPLGSGTFFINVGPFLGYGLNGNVKTTVHQTGVKDSTYKDNFSFTDGGHSAVDFGINAGIGYELPFGLFARIGYEVSLAGLSPNNGYGTQTDNCFNVSIGFLIQHTRKRMPRFHISDRPIHKPFNHIPWPQ